MILVVGLGNPGAAYARHRHNVGFMVVDALVQAYAFGPWRRRFQSQVAEGRLAAEKALALKPETYMNRSGHAVAAALSFFKLTPAHLVVIHDELDLPPGRVRVKKGGGAGGHNGLRSIDQQIGADYWRIRIGIGHPGDRDRVHGYVLSDFAKADLDWLRPLLDACTEAFPLMAEGFPDKFMNRITVLTQPPKPPKPAKAEAADPAAPAVNQEDPQAPIATLPQTPGR